MNLFEYENSIWGNLWDDKSIEELRKKEPIKGTGTAIDSDSSSYYCWQGSRIPCWFE